MRQRLALGAAALLGPLVLVGAAAAADGDTPIDEPVEAVASVIGIGGNSGETRNDFENRSETAGDVGQPGSCPGAACEAPGLNEEGEGDEGEAGDELTPEAVEEETPEAEEEGEGGGPPEHALLPPHENGKGCDDVLFANGGPPFGGHDTPVGPCNGEEEEEPASEETPEAVEEETPEAEDEGSNGNGFGHEKGRGAGHDKGIGEGHAKHGDGAGETADEPAAGATDDGGDAPGNSGGKGKGKNK